MSQRKIKPVTNTIDKQNTYRVLLGRYKKAVQDEFYLEAILIDYALMEDRLRSFIYHSGLLKDRATVGISAGVAKDEIQRIIREYKDGSKKDTDSLDIKSISVKIKIVRCICEWTSKVEGIDRSNPYLYALKTQYESVDIDGLLSVLDDIDDWRNYRNEIIHSLLNKNIDSLNEQVKERAEAGMKYARFLDSQVTIVKKGNRIRKSLGLRQV